MASDFVIHVVLKAWILGAGDAMPTPPHAEIRNKASLAPPHNAGRLWYAVFLTLRLQIAQGNLVVYLVKA